MRAGTGAVVFGILCHTYCTMSAQVPADPNVVQQGNTITVTPNTQQDEGDSFQEISNAVEQQELNKKSSWPELVGQDCKVAQHTLESTTDKNVYLVPPGSMVTMDFRKDRVRIYCDAEGMVSKPPRVG